MVSVGPHGLRKQPQEGDQASAGHSVPATCFPAAAALGSSFDVELVRRVGVAIGQEARTQHVAVVLGPGINIKRTPLCGRNFEYFSKDPLLSGELGAAMISGIQSQGVGASLKHFAVNNQETDRLRINALIDEQTLREIYLSGFERVVRQARPWTVMCSYNRINGIYASQDPWLLTDVLRREWGFEGVVISDWGAVDDPVAALSAGLDLEMPSSHGEGARQIEAAVARHELDETQVDAASTRLLTLVERGRAGAEDAPSFDARSHHELAREVAADCVVLLKNDGSLLPLDERDESLAVIGEFARRPHFQGAGSSKVNPTMVDVALEGLRERLGEHVRVDFEPGFGLDDPDADNDQLLERAVDLSRRAKTVLLFLGLPESDESEGFDRAHIELPVEQVRLVRAVSAVNQRVVVVLSNGAVVETSSWHDHAAAIVETWLAGQAGGAAIVDVLVGDVNPSGRLAETIPVRLSDTPAYTNFPGQDGDVLYGEETLVSYRYYDVVDRPVSFPLDTAFRTRSLRTRTFWSRSLILHRLRCTGEVTRECRSASRSPIPERDLAKRSFRCT